MVQVCRRSKKLGFDGRLRTATSDFADACSQLPLDPDYGREAALTHGDPFGNELFGCIPRAQLFEGAAAAFVGMYGAEESVRRSLRRFRYFGSFVARGWSFGVLRGMKLVAPRPTEGGEIGGGPRN